MLRLLWPIFRNLTPPQSFPSINPAEKYRANAVAFEVFRSPEIRQIRQYRQSSTDEFKVDRMLEANAIIWGALAREVMQTDSLR
jgi:hypothetical protein